MFKGKSTKDGSWLYGSLLQLKGLVFIIPDDVETIEPLGDYKVDPDTVCEKTELYNHGEQDIWEHDYIADNGTLYEVRKQYDCPGGCWAESGFILYGVNCSGFLSFEDTIVEYYNEICVQIIGNKFDNSVEGMIAKAEELGKQEEDYLASFNEL